MQGMQAVGHRKIREKRKEVPFTYVTFLSGLFFPKRVGQTSLWSIFTGGIMSSCLTKWRGKEISAWLGMRV